MTHRESQSDSPPDTAVFISFEAGSRRYIDFLTSLGADVDSLHPRQPTSLATLQTTNRRNEKGKRRIQDHPGWSAYLSQCRILEPAIVAKAWVEHEEWSRQDVLVWRTRRRDGSPGATRHRLLKAVKVKGT